MHYLYSNVNLIICGLADGLSPGCRNRTAVMEELWSSRVVRKL